MSLLDTASLVITPNGTKASKLYSVVPSSGAGDMTVTRATTATRVNSAGLIESVASNVPRLDYTNGTCPSILVEPQRTNVALYSQSATTSVVNVGYTATDNNTTSPDGTINGARVLESTGTIQLIQKSFIVSSISDSYSASFFVKANGRSIGQILYGLNGAPFSSVSATFNLSNGTITSATGSNGATAISSKIENFGNGWFRVSVSGIIGTIGTHYVRLQDANGDVAGDPTKGFFIYGFQLEAGSYATSYIPTTSASVTRNADVISKTGISSLIGQTEGTMFLDVYRPNSNSPFIFMLANSTGANAYANSIYLFQTPTQQLACDIFISGVQQVGINTSSLGISVGRNKIAIAYKQNDFALYINGTQIGTDTSGNIPTLSAFEINGADISSVSNVDVNLTALWKTRLTNTQLAQLTTI